MKVAWSDETLEQLQFWKHTNPKMSKRIRLLIDNIILTPYTGIGKPEPLKYEAKALFLVLTYLKKILAQFKLALLFTKNCTGIFLLFSIRK
ncbi:type II toxin-antitoxin system YoeB family toxin [Rickettsia koreansis]|uniref:type II toxin-antitoxin system YoeB family toxin n=1 Tax=Rickettsia koreansis TaxID=2358204 RepID=UPI00397E06A0